MVSNVLGLDLNILQTHNAHMYLLGHKRISKLLDERLSLH